MFRGFILRDEEGTVEPDQTGGDENEGGKEGDEKPTEPSADERKAARRKVLETLSLEAERAAAGQTQNQATETVTATDDEFEVELDGVDASTAKSVKAALKKAQKVQESANRIAEYGIQQARKVAAYEAAKELDAWDDVEYIEKALSTANSPQQIDVARRELVIKLRDDGTPARKSEAKQKPAATKDKRTFDSGRNSGGNRVRALEEKIDAIDPSKPGAIEELAKLEREVEEAQKAFERRSSRRSN
jgi:hypothetical protein